MIILYTIILGIIQGLTEFIPVSSSGHLVILHDLLKFNFADNLGFDVSLHLGTLLALILFFRKEIIKYLKAFFGSLVKFDLKENIDQKISWQILIATIPVLLVGYFFEDKISLLFRKPSSVAIMLILIGLLFFYIEKKSEKTKDMNGLDWMSAIMIGIFQIFALVPGISRSGITIIAGMNSGLKRTEAAKFSFLLAIPAIFLASVKKFYDLYFAGINSNEIYLYVLGTIFSFVAGFLAIKYLLKFLEKYSLNWFGWYRIVLGIIILILALR